MSTRETKLKSIGRSEGEANAESRLWSSWSCSSPGLKYILSMSADSTRKLKEREERKRERLRRCGPPMATIHCVERHTDPIPSCGGGDGAHHHPVHTQQASPALASSRLHNAALITLI
ncbi:hypothetical protein KQX54_003335 [Cotesia glomerata]|uniref:Uncharacterized protein n=1 Tax=Cotesia glomerata TaxID=32391 RepID=A0AAV7J4H7_COTGL|nr:hypothetical protein KQX54_003335 [Cotesia glomerata]